MLIHGYWKCKIVQPPWKTVLQFLQRLNIYLLHDSAISILEIYPRQKKKSICPYRDWDTNIPSNFIWYNPNNPGVHEQVNG